MAAPRIASAALIHPSRAGTSRSNHITGFGAGADGCVRRPLGALKRSYRRQGTTTESCQEPTSGKSQNGSSVTPAVRLSSSHPPTARSPVVRN
jgi:hypothetical protein